MTRVLVDTSVWSLALRKKSRTAEEEKLIGRLSELLRELQMVIIGPIRQELLSGISETSRYEDLRHRMSFFPDLEVVTRDYELAAKYFNDCRRNGVQGSHIDFLICAVATNNGLAILTLDQDFKRYQEFIGISLEENFSP